MTMKKMYRINKCNKYRKFWNPKVSYIFNIALVIFILFRKCGSKNENLIKK